MTFPLFDGLEEILLNKVPIVCEGLVEGVADVAELVDGAHGLAVGHLNVRRKGLDGVEHHLRGGDFAKVLDEMLGVPLQRRNITRDDSLFFIGQ